ncbi:collagen-like protein [Comamonas sp. B21-038]|uniref:collagen-like protein n=1 Tax=Comamonas sp. B21-038 TaxID=2918299 RepID=UPI001EFAC423|nr:collagen-like protein [Comamonas sp. B21-038]ULR87183.1 collagen-like protein [Comamonas sp. B21-038]
MNTKQLDSIAEVVSLVVAESLAPVLQRLKALEELRTKAAEPGQPGRDGKDGADGRDGKDGEPGTDGRDGLDGKDGQPGKDGVDGRSFTIEDADALLSEKMARWELDFERRAADKLDAAIAKMPIPKDGRDGRDGADGKNGADGLDAFQLEDAAFEMQADGRTLKILFQREGDAWKYTHAVKLSHMVYQGIYSEAKSYDKGDCVTFGGSLWHAKHDAVTAKPGTDEDAWALAVKKGRDGRDGRDGVDKSAPVKLGG